MEVGGILAKSNIRQVDLKITTGLSLEVKMRRGGPQGGVWGAIICVEVVFMSVGRGK